MIQNERQRALAAAQVRKLEAALADVSSRPRPAHEHPKRKKLEIGAIRSEVEALTVQIAEFDALLDTTVAPVTNLADLPSALIRKRIAGRITHKELAQRLQLKEQQIQRYEANGYASANLDRLITIAKVLDIDIQVDVSAETRFRLPNLVARLSSLGFDRNFILRRLASPAASAAAAKDYARSTIDLVARVGRMFGISPDVLLGNEPLTFGSNIVASAFKTPPNANEAKVQAFTAYAQYLTRVVLEHYKPQTKAPRLEALALHDELRKHHDDVDFQALLDWSWGHGIAVLPIFEPGGFHAALFPQPDGRAVIVLKNSATHAARWTFDLLHELGHLFTGNGKGRIVIDASPETDTHDEELTANRFASDVIFRGRAAEFFIKVQDRACHKGPHLKRAVLAVAQEQGVPVASLAFDVAYRLYHEQEFDWWGPAQNIAKQWAGNPAEATVRALLKNIDVDALAPIDRDLFLQAISL